MLRMTGVRLACPLSSSLAYFSYMWSMYWGGATSLSPESGIITNLVSECEEQNLNKSDCLIRHTGSEE